MALRLVDRVGFLRDDPACGQFPARGVKGNPIRLVALQTDSALEINCRLDRSGDSGQIDRLCGDSPAADDRRTLSADFTAGGPPPRIGLEYCRPGRWIEMNPSRPQINLGINHVKFVFGEDDLRMNVYLTSTMG